MSKTKSAKMYRLHNYSPEQYRHCDKCGIVIATTWANWKYKYCEQCSFKEIDKFRKDNGSFRISGGLRKRQISKDYGSGKRWLKDRCEICGYTEALDIHRIIPAKDYGTYAPDNVVTLCPNCHALITRNKKKLHIETQGNNRIYKLVDNYEEKTRLNP